MAPKILDWKKIDPAKHFRFGMPRGGMGHGGFSVNLEVWDDETGRAYPFVHQAPALSLPFGFSSKESANGIRHTAVFSFPTVRLDPATGKYNGDEEMVRYLQFIEGIDKCNKDKAFDNCKAWFKKDQQRPVIDEFYFANLYSGAKALAGEYSPTFTTKLPEAKGKFTTQFYSFSPDTQGVEEIQHEDVVGSVRKVIPLIETRGLWFAGKQFGMSFRVLQMVIYKNEQFEGCVINPEAFMDYAKVPQPLSIAGFPGVVVKKRVRDLETGEGPVSKVAALNLPEEVAEEATA